ncbi:Uncharacterised protein [uncultured archaeon]|nr:Uncharacterised protein [uncultured archaeon]
MEIVAFCLQIDRDIDYRFHVWPRKTLMRFNHRVVVITNYHEGIGKSGKRGPKPKFSDVACPNEECEHYGLTDQGNVVGNVTYETKSGRVRRMSQRSTAEVLEVCPKSVSTWISRASDQSEAVSEANLKDLKVSKVEMDELWTFTGKRESRKTKNTKTTEHGSG